MTIGKIAEQTGVLASTFRYYEHLEVLAKKVLRLAQACGFHLDEMRTLVNSFDAWDLAGVVICLMGSGNILLGREKEIKWGCLQVPRASPVDY